VRDDLGGGDSVVTRYHECEPYIEDYLRSRGATEAVCHVRTAEIIPGEKVARFHAVRRGEEKTYSMDLDGTVLFKNTVSTVVKGSGGRIRSIVSAFSPGDVIRRTIPEKPGEEPERVTIHGVVACYKTPVLEEWIEGYHTPPLIVCKRYLSEKLVEAVSKELGVKVPWTKEIERRKRRAEYEMEMARRLAKRILEKRRP